MGASSKSGPKLRRTRISAGSQFMIYNYPIELKEGNDGQGFHPPANPFPVNSAFVFSVIGAEVFCPQGQDAFLSLDVGFAQIPIVLVRQGNIDANSRLAAWQHFPTADVQPISKNSADFKFVRSAKAGIARASLVIWGYLHTGRPQK